ncbi:MAG: putative toxin-antitoxin system toxin component, PIN family [Mycobacteriales bacterium]
MRRLVIDAGVWISALITPTGAGAQLATAFLRNEIQVYASPHLLEELSAVLERPKFRRWCTPTQAQDLVRQIAERAELVPDILSPPKTTRDPKDDYLVALATTYNANLVSGDTEPIVTKSARK